MPKKKTKKKKKKNEALTEAKIIAIRDSMPKIEPDENGMVEVLTDYQGRQLLEDKLESEPPKEGGAWC